MCQKIRYLNVYSHQNLFSNKIVSSEPFQDVPPYNTLKISWKKYNSRFVFNGVDIPFVHTKLLINRRKMDLASLLLNYLTDLFEMIPIGLWRYNFKMNDTRTGFRRVSSPIKQA